METPTRYYVDYVTRWNEDEAPDVAIVNCDTLKRAEGIYWYHAHRDHMPRIFERLDIRDATPAREPIRGLIWDFEERIVKDQPS